MRTAGNASINTVNGAATTCNNGNDHAKCLEGSYCTGASDACTGTCNPSCLKCNGSSSSSCSVCSPLSTTAHLGTIGSSISCDGCKYWIIFIYLNFYYYFFSKIHNLYFYFQ